MYVVVGAEPGAFLARISSTTAAWVASSRSMNSSHVIVSASPGGGHLGHDVRGWAAAGSGSGRRGAGVRLVVVGDDSGGPGSVVIATRPSVVVRLAAGRGDARGRRTPRRRTRTRVLILATIGG